MCNNTIGSFNCSCDLGYQLDENRLNCSGETYSTITLVCDATDMLLHVSPFPSLNRH